MRSDNSITGHDMPDSSITNQSEDKLQYWIKRYELIVESSGQVAYEYIVPTGQITWGSSIEKVLGYNAAEINDGFIQWQNLLHPDDEEETLKGLIAAQKVCAFWNYQYRLRHKRGDYVWIRDRGFFTPDAEGQAYSKLGMLEDITDRKRWEEALQKSEENFRRFLDDSPLGARIVSETGETIYANQSLLDIYGYKNIEELKNSSVKKRYTPANYSDFLLRRKK
jgi:PAS domain S-box-containing protein